MKQFITKFSKAVNFRIMIFINVVGRVILDPDLRIWSRSEHNLYSQIEANLMDLSPQFPFVLYGDCDFVYVVAYYKN